MNRHSNQTLKIADDLVSNYSKRGRGTLSISMSDLPTYEQQDLAAHMLCDDPMRASEALGEDNPFFERGMKDLTGNCTRNQKKKISGGLLVNTIGIAMLLSWMLVCFWIITNY